MNIAPIVKTVRAYDSTEWEIFISEWQKGLEEYLEVKRLGGAGDHGRDVIGLTDENGCDGVWDNFQCKHYEKPLATPKACEDAGKIIFHSYRKVFAPPRKCKFVAPRGPSTELRDLLLNPIKFREELLTSWNTRVAKQVVAGESHLLEGDLRQYVENYDFKSFGFATIDEVLDDHRKTAYWASRFGGLLPPPPPGITPIEIADKETTYVKKLCQVYEEAMGSPVLGISDLPKDSAWTKDLQSQRVRFYDAEYFMAHYRDQTTPGTIEDFAEQIYDSIEPSLSISGTGQARLTNALTIAAQAKPANVLEPQAKVRVKQGVCHQLANDDRLNWTV